MPKILKKGTKTIAFVAVKGGVGKTTLSMNTARRLKDKHNINVGYIDADFDNSNFAQFTNTNTELKIIDNKEFQLFDWKGIQVFSMSLIAGRKKSVSMTGDRYAHMIRDVLVTSNWNCDYFIVDLPSGSSTIFRSIMQLFGETICGNIVVSQPSMVDALNRALSLHQYFKIPILGVVNNMAYLECPHCNEASFPFGKGKTVEISNQYGSKVVAEIPLCEEIAEKQLIGEAILPEKYLPFIDNICDVIIKSQPTETGIFEKFKETVGSSIKSTVVKVLTQMILVTNKEFDFKTFRRQKGFLDRKIFRLTITDEALTKELSHVDLRLDDTGLKGIKEANKIDYEMVMDYKTLARTILKKRKNNGNIEPFDPMDAWLNGDIKVYGQDGHSVKTVHTMREVLLDDNATSQVASQYEKILEMFI